MAVGTTPLTFYQGESISPRFTVSDARVTDVTGWTTIFEIKVGPEDVDPPLHSAAGVVFGSAPTLIIDVPTNLPLTLAPGSYFYGLRRTNVGFSWQIAHAQLTILDSVNEDTA